MTGPSPAFESLSSAALLAATRDLVRKSRGVEAELLSHLGEIDERKLYLDCASSSMFAFCVHELGFSEDVAYNRITVARAGRRLPAVVEAVRSGQVHLAGLRLLAPHLTSENHREVLAQAAGRSKREIEELVARLAPQPPAVALVRKLPERPGLALAGSEETYNGRGRRCAETSALELDHLDGFARTHRHEAARQMYGRAFVEEARASTTT